MCIYLKFNLDIPNDYYIYFYISSFGSMYLNYFMCSKVFYLICLECLYFRFEFTNFLHGSYLGFDLSKIVAQAARFSLDCMMSVMFPECL